MTWTTTPVTASHFSVEGVLLSRADVQRGATGMCLLLPDETDGFYHGRYYSIGFNATINQMAESLPSWFWYRHPHELPWPKQPFPVPLEWGSEAPTQAPAPTPDAPSPTNNAMTVREKRRDSRYGTYSDTCTCVFKPLDGIIGITHQFYEAETYLAILQGLGVDSASYGGLYEGMLRGALRYTTKQLDDMWIRYLAVACAGELRHAARHALSDWLYYWPSSIGDIRHKIERGLSWRASVRLMPCPICDTGAALDFFRAAHGVFSGEWVDNAYGGGKWAGVCETLVARMSSDQVVAGTGPGCKWTIPVHGNVQPLDGEASLAKMFQNRVIFVDYANDLEHNGGCVLGKGWITVSREEFISFLDFKRRASLLNHPRFFPQIAHYLRCRLHDARGVIPWDGKRTYSTISSRIMMQGKDVYYGLK